MAARIEATDKGLDVRYVVTNIRQGGAQWLYDSLYCARGQAENLIKRHQSQLASDRTSCRSPPADRMRLILHTATYWVMRVLRDAIPRRHGLSCSLSRTGLSVQHGIVQLNHGFRFMTCRPVFTSNPAAGRAAD